MIILFLQNFLYAKHFIKVRQRTVHYDDLKHKIEFFIQGSNTICISNSNFMAHTFTYFHAHLLEGNIVDIEVYHKHNVIKLTVKFYYYE